METVPNRLVSGLGHADPIVRDACLGILAEERETGLEVTRAAITAIEREGWEAAFTCPHELVGLEQDAETVAWALGVMEAPAEAPPGPRTRSHLLRWLVRAPVECLAPCQNRVSAVATMLMGEVEAVGVVASLRCLVERPVFASMSQDTLLEQMAFTCAQAGEAEDFPRDQVDRIENIVEALAARAGAAGDPRLAEEARKWLALDLDGSDPAHPWLLGAGIQLAGRLGLRDTFDTLLEILELDSDWWNEEIQIALVRMADVDLAERVAADYADAPWEARLYLGTLFERFRPRELEATLCGLVEEEEDDLLRVSLAEGLALYGTATATALAVQVAEEDPDDPERVGLIEALYALDVLAGNPPVGRQARWRVWLEEERELFRRTVEEGLGEWAPPPSNLIPFERPAEKVGRNDPCPCGSGRKYKKCCLGKDGSGDGPETGPGS